MSHFGKRFRRKFPTADLPKPIRESVVVKDYIELNELETIWMFLYHTWRGYGGMNMTFPGSADYYTVSSLGGSVGHGKNLTKEGSRLGGLNQPKDFKRLGGFNQPKKFKSHGGIIGTHRQWHLAKGVFNPKCIICQGRS